MSGIELERREISFYSIEEISLKWNVKVRLPFLRLELRVGNYWAHETMTQRSPFIADQFN